VFITHPNQEYIDVKFKFDLLYFKDNYLFEYGTTESRINITDKVLNECLKDNNIYIPDTDTSRANIFGDPCPGILKSIFIENPDTTMVKYSSTLNITVSHNEIKTFETIVPVIVAIAKLESDYILEWVIYHLALGFKKIYLYDNEDLPKYGEILRDYSDYVVITHIPGNKYHKPIQYFILDNFITYHMRNGIITHCTHIDIDEFIVLKKHSNITDFILEYIKDDCAGIGMNWRFFGDSGLTEQDPRPVTERFTRCQRDPDETIKTIFDVRKTTGWWVCHCIYTNEGYYVKSTAGKILKKAHNKKLNKPQHNMPFIQESSMFPSHQASQH
jgi:hypothetical protein